ncbi:hypothetical protein [Bacillus sp. WC2507]|uniref:hypothetical protein n=1 Tax=Bacillus sp. WC2507 TaxID=3461404 RepID=UPI004042AE2C
MKKSVLVVGLSVVMLAACSEKEMVQKEQQKTQQTTVKTEQPKDEQTRMTKSIERRTKEIIEYFGGTVTAVELNKENNLYVLYVFVSLRQHCQMLTKAYEKISATEREQS